MYFAFQTYICMLAYTSGCFYLLSLMLIPLSHTIDQPPTPQ